MSRLEEFLRYFKEMGGIEELEQFKRDTQFVSEHWAELLGKYPDKWIGVKDGEVVAVSDDLKDLVSAIPE